MPDPSIQDFIVFHGPVEFVHWEHTSNNGARMKLGMMHLDDLEPFDRAVKRTKRRAGQRYMAAWQTAQGEELNDLPNEVWFAGASWSHAQGATVMFSIQPEFLPALMNLTTRDNTLADYGTRVYMALVEIDADEQFVNQRQRDMLEALAVEPKKGGPVSRNAGMLCQDEQFQRFLQARFQTPCKDHQQAAALVRQHCGIKSRAELDHDDEAKGRYEDLKRDFTRWGQRYG